MKMTFCLNSVPIGIQDTIVFTRHDSIQPSDNTGVKTLVLYKIRYGTFFSRDPLLRISYSIVV